MGDKIESEMGKDPEMNSRLTETIMSSEKRLSELTEECADMVINVQIANDTREIKRREEEDKLSEARREIIEREAKKAQEQINFINSKWESIAKIKDSVDIHSAYESQKSNYLELIQEKDEVIEELQKQLEEMDHKYIQDQILHREDINILTKRINEHFDIMQNAYRKHLKLIENTAFDEQKAELHCKFVEWENQNDIFEQEKAEDMNKIFESVETFEKEIIDTIWDHSEKHRSMKRDLEDQLQALQIAVKETKNYCILKERKLEYNYLVLCKRQEELGPIKARQRRRINRLHDELINLENEERDMEKIHKMNCARLEMEISKLEMEEDALIQKMKRSDEVNDNVFYKTWKLNEKRIRKTLDKILKIDQQINEQVLHLEWSPPTLKFKTVSELPSIQLYTERIPFSQQPESNLDFESPSIFTIRDYPQLSFDFDILNFIINNVIDCIKYVVKDKIDYLTEDLDEEKKILVKFDHILKILGIKNENELESLKEYFLPYITCVTCANKSRITLPAITRSGRNRSPKITHRSGSGNLSRKKSTRITKRPSSTPRNFNYSGEITDQTPVFCQNSEHKWTIDQYIVVKVLADFIEDKKQYERPKDDSKLTKIPLARVLTPSDIELYWKSFKPAYINELEELWNILLVPFNDYLQLLKDGNKIGIDIKILEKQNSELRRALSSFLEKDCEREEKS